MARRLLERRSLTRNFKVALAIFAGLAAAIVFAGFRYYQAQRAAVERATHAHISAIAQGRAGFVYQWREERLATGRVMQEQSPHLSAVWPKLCTPELPPWPDSVRRWLGSFGRAEYARPMIVARDGMTGTWGHGERLVLSDDLKETVRSAWRSRRPKLSEIHDYRGSVHIDLVVPLFSPAGAPEGALSFHVSPETALFPLLELASLRFGSEEVQLVRRAGNAALYITPPARSASAPMGHNLDDQRQAAAYAAAGHEGVFEALDYRGEKVLAAAVRIPDSNWWLVAKVDRDEVAARLGAEARATAIVAGLLIAVAALALLFVWRRRVGGLYRELYRAELAHRALSGHYGYLSRYANDLILLCDENGTIVEVNERVCSALGRSRLDMVGRPCHELICPDALDGFEQRWAEAAKSDGVVFETEFPRAGGSKMPVEVSARSIEVEGRRFLQAIARDITERKNSEEDWRAMLRATTDGFCVLDSEARFVDVNAAYCEISGFTREELVGTDITQTPPEQGLTDLGQHVENLRRHGADHWETWYRRPDGRYYELDVSAQFLPGKQRVFAFVRDVTARNRTLRELEQSQKLVSRIVEHAPSLIYVIDVQRLRLTFFNRSPQELGGVGALPGELAEEGLDLRTLADPEQVLELEQFSREIGELADGEVRSTEYRVLRGGLWRTLSCREVVFSRAPDGSVRELLGLGEDITDRLAAAETLRRTSEMLKASFEVSPLGTVLMDLDGRVLSWNPAAERMFGWTETEVLGQPLPTVPAERRHELHDLIRNTTSGEGVSGRELVRRRKDGSQIDVSVWTAPVHDAAGRATAVLSVFADFTERKRARRELERSRALLINAHQMARLGLWEVDVVSGKSEWSDNLYALLGLAKETTTARWETYEKLIHPDDLERVARFRAHTHQRGRPGRLDHRIVRPDGTVRHVRQWVEAHLDARGQLVGVTGTLQDITEHRALEEQLWQAQKLEPVGRLAGGIAHDFNNLLTVINGYSELLLRRASEQPSLHQGLSEIHAAGQRAAELTGKLLAFSRKQLMEPRPMNINDVVNGMLNMLSRLMGPGIALVTDLAPDLDQIEADPVQMEQVLLNLSVNARDAMPDGGTLRISTANAEEPDGGVLLRVADTGMGMSEETRIQLFEPFFTTKEPGKGTGLGLSIVFGIVQQSGGTISVESAPGRGAIFTLRLPAIVRAATAPA